MKIKSIVALCMAFVGFTASADTYMLSLEESIELAKEKSYTMRNLKEELKIAEYNLKSATSSLKTHIDFNLTMPEFNQTVRTWDDTTGVSFYSIKRMDYGGMVHPQKQACGMECELGNTVRFAAYRSLPNRKGSHGLPRWRGL